jgi:peptide deformylase
MPLKIIQAGDPVLRQRAREVTAEEIRSRDLQQLIEEMRETMRSAPGVGLAAPQVGRSLQLAVIEDRAEYHKELAVEQLQARGRKPVPFYVLINPEIVARSSDHAMFFEGCLSLAGFSALVPRCASVRVSFLDEKGESRTLDAAGWHARIIQHEVDHLLGGLYIDRMLSRTFTSVENLTLHWKDRSAEDVIRGLR